MIKKKSFKLNHVKLFLFNELSYYVGEYFCFIISMKRFVVYYDWCATTLNCLKITDTEMRFRYQDSNALVGIIG